MMRQTMQLVGDAAEETETVSCEASTSKSAKITVKREIQAAEEAFIKSEVLNTDLLQVNIKIEPTDDSSIHQTSEQHGSDCAAKTIDNLYIKQEYDDTAMKLDIERNDANLIHINSAIIKQESHDNNLQKYHNPIYESITPAESSNVYRAWKRSEASEKGKPKTGAERARAYRARKKGEEKVPKPKPKTAAERAKAYRDRKKTGMFEKPKPKTTAERVRAYRDRKKPGMSEKAKPKITTDRNRQLLESNQSHLFAKNDEQWITVKSEIQLQDDSFIESEVFNNVETVWLKTADEKSMKQEFTINTDLFQVDIKEEPTDDTSLNQTNEHHGSDCAAETIDSLYVKQEYGDTDTKVDIEPGNDGNLIDTESHDVLNEEKHDDNLYIQADISNEGFVQSSPQILIHTSEKPYQCDVCNKCFAKRRNLRIHKQLHSGRKPYKCHVCDKSFSRLYNLKRHRIVHTNEKPFECDVCNNSYKSLSCLKEHKYLHSGDKPHKCEHCRKGFSRLSYLKQHMVIHTNEKPYKCDICEKYFSQVCNLNTHKRRHTGVKPYQCDVCNKGFTKSSHLNVHKRTHTGEKPYQGDD